jgi:hypothetical protein
MSPNPITFFTLATWFGLTGATMTKDVAVKPGPDWQMDANREDNCIVVVQQLHETEDLS